MTGRWLRLLVPVKVSTILWQVADGPEAVRRLRGPDLPWLTLALVTVLAQTGLSALR